MKIPEFCAEPLAPLSTPSITVSKEKEVEAEKETVAPLSEENESG